MLKAKNEMLTQWHQTLRTNGLGKDGLEMVQRKRNLSKWATSLSAAALHLSKTVLCKKGSYWDLWKTSERELAHPLLLSLKSSPSLPTPSSLHTRFLFLVDSTPLSGSVRLRLSRWKSPVCWWCIVFADAEAFLNLPVHFCPLIITDMSHVTLALRPPCVL